MEKNRHMTTEATTPTGLKAFTSEETSMAEGVGTESLPCPRKPRNPRLSFITFAKFDQVKVWASTGVLALLDQGLISGSNFVLGIALARWGGPESYGAYMVMFAAFLLIANVYQALVLEPANVLAFSLFSSNNSRYVRVLLRMHAVFSVCFIMVGGTALLLAPYCGVQDTLVNALAGLLIATPCVLLFWMARCFAYIEFSPEKALRGSFLYFCVLLAALFFAYLSAGLTPLRVFVCSACAACAASLTLLLRYRHPEASTEQTHSFRTVWLRHWEYGRWGLGGVGMLWAQTNSISITSGYVLGLGGIGGLNALVGLGLPVGQVLSASTRIALPRIARIYANHGANATHRPVIRVAIALTVSTVLYWLAISAVSGPLFRFVYGMRFAQFAYLVPIISLNVIPWAVITACDIALNSIQQPQASFRLKAVMVAITVSVTTAATWRYGLPGAVIAIPACGFMTAMCLALKLRTVWHKNADLQ